MDISTGLESWNLANVKAAKQEKVKALCIPMRKMGGILNAYTSREHQNMDAVDILPEARTMEAIRLLAAGRHCLSSQDFLTILLPSAYTLCTSNSVNFYYYSSVPEITNVGVQRRRNTGFVFNYCRRIKKQENPCRGLRLFPTPHLQQQSGFRPNSSQFTFLEHYDFRPGTPNSIRSILPILHFPICPGPY
jgi:hypothetical protein